MPEHVKVVSRIAALREKAGLTQVQVAVLIGVTPNTIQNWEKGTSGIDQIERFLKLCEILGCNLQDLIEYVADSQPRELKSKSFSLEELRELRQRWGADTKANTTESDSQIPSKYNLEVSE